MSAPQSIGPALWPPALKAIRRPRSTAKRTVVDDVVRRLRVDDGDGPLVDGQVPGLPRGVPRLVARQDDVALDASTQSSQSHPGPSCHPGVSAPDPTARHRLAPMANDRESYLSRACTIVAKEA